tara:strand:+ start:14822 stop:15412 length:591 start_codon:yes stop_codon:yes gene_type:complete
METNKILSFEEFSSRGTDTATATVDTDTVDTTGTDTVDTTNTETTTDTDTVDTDAETTTDTETTDTEETEETEDDVEESNDAEAKNVTDLLTELKDCMITEAKAWEADEYDEHTIESYLKENTSLYASIITNTLEEIKNADESYTKESYESTCNELKAAYAKRCDEAYEAYGAHNDVNAENEVESQEDAVVANPAK